MESELEKRKARWRMVLGPSAQDRLGPPSTPEEVEQDEALDFLYGREYGPGRNIRPSGQDSASDSEGQVEKGAQPGDEGSASGGGAGRAVQKQGGVENSNLTVPTWVHRLQTLFPKKSAERLQHDALHRYGLHQWVTDAELLKQATPDLGLLKAILQTRSLMSAPVLGVARQIVKQVVDDLLRQWAWPIRSAFWGQRSARPTRRRASARQFDPKNTVKHNMKFYDPESKQLIVRHPYFIERQHRQLEKWKVILLVDQSGSMLEGIIHAAITAGVLASVPGLKYQLVVFDTNVVDLTEHCQDPVETLFRVQLGGGTNIAKALAFAQTQVIEPRHTLVVLLSDLYEAGSADRMLGCAQGLLESGVTLLALAALDERADPSFDRQVGQQLSALGAQVAALTPDALAQWLAESMQK